jgi:D-sedoheptulose 7-phosphate isomerase
MNMKVSDYFGNVNDALQKVDAAAVERFAGMLLETCNAGGTVYAFGNGGSGATASHFCGDLVKGVSHGLDRRFRAVCLNDSMPGVLAIANDISYSHIFVEQLRNFLRQGDLVVGFSGSGNSENVVLALEYAKSCNIHTVALCGFDRGKAGRIAELAVHVPVMDMELSEDIHLVITHAVKRLLMERLHARSHAAVNLISKGNKPSTATHHE